MRNLARRGVAAAIACGLAVGLAATGLSSGAPTVQQQSEPTFSCCEKDIKIGKLDVIPQATQFQPGSITVAIVFVPELHWKCDKADKDCFAFYNVTIGRPNQWDLFRDGKWRPLAGAFTDESITAQTPLKVKCDGGVHKGAWQFTYRAKLTTTADQVRNLGLRIDLDIPAAKGKSYNLEVEITGVDRQKPGVPTVKVKKLKEKEKPAK